MRLDLAAILVAVAGGALWIEQDHRVVIDAPSAAEIASAAACPDNDTVPYDRYCLDFLAVPAEPAPRLQARAVVSPAAPSACPDNDKVPYSQGCLEYLKGATETGMRWRMTETPTVVSAPAPK